MSGARGSRATVAKVVAGGGCTGCGSCEASCPKGCISMEPDAEGFLAPRVDSSACVGCGRCLGACHTLASMPLRSPRGLIAVSSAPEARRSSSGGVFAALAARALDMGWAVYGAAFDERFHLVHIRARDGEGLASIQGSKYVQSDTRGVFAEVESDLSTGRGVLFSGTPCQVAGLLAYLGGPRDGLVLIDIVCHGVPSPGFWDAYIAKKGERAPLVGVAFRQKTPYERGTYALRLEKPKGVRVVPAMEDPYFAMFLKGLDFRECCYRCPYASLRRPGDITLGDCNTIDRYPDFHPAEVVSTVLLNTSKGEEFWSGASAALDAAPLDVGAEAAANAQLGHPFTRPAERTGIYGRALGMSEAELTAAFAQPPSLKEGAKRLARCLVPLKTRLAIKKMIRSMRG